eukprot:GHVQ01038984.1.p1 GENE.GHVQ01038984.1~~GHVQ01038984.1.p1  ORF type:complete len:165 (+),score=20.56 GHVQ01038984.1:269-763(+)
MSELAAASDAEGSTTCIENPILEMQINNFRDKLKDFDIDQSISTPKLAAFGMTDCYLQFYPKGSFWCTKEGHFSVLFGCPTSVEVDMMMYAGNISQKPQRLLNTEETNETVYGLHDFGEIDHLFKPKPGQQLPDSLAVGVEFLNIKFLESADKESEKIVRVTCD